MCLYYICVCVYILHMCVCLESIESIEGFKYRRHYYRKKSQLPASQHKKINKPYIYHNNKLNNDRWINMRDEKLNRLPRKQLLVPICYSLLMIVYSALLRVDFTFLAQSFHFPCSHDSHSSACNYQTLTIIIF